MIINIFIIIGARLVHRCQVRSYGVMIRWAAEVVDASNAQGVR